jgi:hypothetical protein
MSAEDLAAAREELDQLATMLRDGFTQLEQDVTEIKQRVFARDPIEDHGDHLLLRRPASMTDAQWATASAALRERGWEAVPRG